MVQLACFTVKKVSKNKAPQTKALDFNKNLFSQNLLD